MWRRDFNYLGGRFSIKVEGDQDRRALHPTAQSTPVPRTLCTMWIVTWLRRVSEDLPKKVHNVRDGVCRIQHLPAISLDCRRLCRLQTLHHIQRYNYHLPDDI
jgi:hypothetical protein